MEVVIAKLKCGEYIIGEFNSGFIVKPYSILFDPKGFMFVDFWRKLAEKSEFKISCEDILTSVTAKKTLADTYRELNFNSNIS